MGFRVIVSKRRWGVERRIQSESDMFQRVVHSELGTQQRELQVHFLHGRRNLKAQFCKTVTKTEKRTKKKQVESRETMFLHVKVFTWRGLPLICVYPA